jgi:hypothetical protein
MHRAGAHLEIERLLQDAAVGAPEFRQLEDQLLECHRPPNAGLRPVGTLGMTVPDANTRPGDARFGGELPSPGVGIPSWSCFSLSTRVPRKAWTAMALLLRTGSDLKAIDKRPAGLEH